jgi:hypothetical protein
LSTNQESRGNFNLAIWTQEDPSSARTHKQVRYPQLSAINFSRLAVNSAAPLGADLLSQWMSENGQILGPTPLADDGFSVVPQQPTLAGSQYLALANAVDAALNTFDAEARRWTGETAPAAIALQRSTLASALETFDASLATDQWPATAQAAIYTLIAANNTELALVQTAPAQSAIGIRMWIKAFRGDDDAAVKAARVVKQELALPTF